MTGHCFLGPGINIGRRGRLRSQWVEGERASIHHDALIHSWRVCGFLATIAQQQGFIDKDSAQA